MRVISGDHAGARERPSPTLLSAVTRAPDEAIVRGEFPPGSALREVSGRPVKASRGTVREALRALSEQGFVEMHSRRAPWYRTSRLSQRARFSVYARCLNPML
jgi:DNA-binding GntR family transcriptional regulator